MSVAGARLASLAFALACWPVADAGGVPEDAEAAAQAVHAAAIVIDGHLDLPADHVDPAWDGAADGRAQIDLPKMERGGLDAAVIALFAWQQADTPEEDAKAVATGRAKLEAVERMVARSPARIGLARSADELEAQAAAGRRAAVLSVLNATVLGRDAELLDAYYARGLRQVGFVHAGHNAFADSSRPMAKNGDAEIRWGGLSPRGRRLVGELNDLGVIVDVSQLSSAAQRETIALSRTPVVASHSAVRARVDAPRNLTDDELRLIARSGGPASAGGVVNVVAFSAYLRTPPPDHAADLQRLRDKYQAPDDVALAKLPDAARNAYNAEYFALLRALPRATVSDLVDSIDHVVRIVGVEHVGIATDFEHAGGVVGFANAGEAPNVTRELLARGYTAPQIDRIWGGNWLRLWREIESQRRPAPGAQKE